MRQSGYETKNLVSKKLHRKLSPLSLSIIAANGNRKKSFFTKISLCLAGIAFMVASSFVFSMNEEKYASQGWMEYGEFVMELSSNAADVNEHGYTGLKQSNPIDEALIEQIKEIEGVKDVIVMGNLHLIYSYHNEKIEDIIIGLTKDEVEILRSYSSNPNMNYDSMIANKEVYIRNNNVAKEIFGWKFKAGDSIRFWWFNGEKYVEDTFTIAGELNDDAYHNKDIYKSIINTGWFIGADKMIEDMMIPGFNLNNALIISCEDYEKYGSAIEEQLKAIKEKNPSLTLDTLNKRIKDHRTYYKSITIGLMGMAFFVIAFSLINLTNTLITNIFARKREIAALRTLGMTQKQVVKMIQGEGLYLAIINILCTSTIGSLAGYFVVHYLSHHGARYLQYQYPVAFLLGYIILVLGITLIISHVSMKSMSKRSLVEVLRETE